MPQRYLTHFNLPDNGNKDLKNHYYSFDWGDVHFTVLDTSLYEEKEWLPDLYEKENRKPDHAHLHTYRDRGHIYDFKRSDKGPVYVIDGLSGNVRYPDLWKQHALDQYVAPQPESDNYSILESDGRQLTLTGYLPDGTKLHETVVKKGE